MPLLVCPPLQLPPAVHAKLERIALWVVQVLEELTTALRVGPDKVKIPAMPKSAVRHTQVGRVSLVSLLLWCQVN